MEEPENRLIYDVRWLCVIFCWTHQFPWFIDCWGCCCWSLPKSGIQVADRAHYKSPALCLYIFPTVRLSPISENLLITDTAAVAPAPTTSTTIYSGEVLNNCLFREWHPSIDKHHPMIQCIVHVVLSQCWGFVQHFSGSSYIAGFGGKMRPTDRRKGSALIF